MKLYNLPRGTWFRILDNTECGPFKLDHIDGMYSLCWVKDERGIPQITHIAAYAEVIAIDSQDSTH
jgi:hypothetical protein